MSGTRMKPIPIALALVLTGAGAPALAQAGRPAFGQFGGANKQPINIEAERLDVFQKEERAVYQGNVVAVQGETTIRCMTLTVHFERKPGAAPATIAPAAVGATPVAAAAPKAEGGGIRQLDCIGSPASRVTVVSKSPQGDQVATANSAIYDRAGGKVTLSGDVILNQGSNVTTGDQVVYDVNSGVATVVEKVGGRVRGVFVPGSEPKEPKPAPAATPADPKAKPVQAAPQGGAAGARSAGKPAAPPVPAAQASSPPPAAQARQAQQRPARRTEPTAATN